ncbi:MAG: Sua5/YciO/YrdC/YwlC family protein [Candidatus Electryonea clarkiae]|nr:Sua5/YciO/YrdC/YwlC family protein [Candidatus Electryonea clarkiae]MDP8286846.1 Sua5/YciO/YrdC/YwlC family protein [Candidatus Electryonea clarkiae]
MVIAELQRDQAPVDVVDEVTRRLERGEVLIMPSDTVYGLHALASNVEAVDRIRKIKGIPDQFYPFTTIFSSVVDIGRWVILPEGADRRKVVDSWPGPITWVLPAKRSTPAHLLGDEGTLGIRIPRHPLLRAVTMALDDLVVSTSANIHHQPPPVSRDSISSEIMEKVDGAVFELENLHGRPSEVKRWTPAGPEILRSRMDDNIIAKERVNILIICSGNICRSPMAEVVLSSRLKELAPNQFVVRSAGTIAQTGWNASMHAVEAIREKGCDLSNHLSRRVNRDLVEWADIILNMSRDHLGDLHADFPEFSGKMYLFTTFPRSPGRYDEGVDDPYGLDMETYRNVAEIIVDHVDRIIPHLLERVQR